MDNNENKIKYWKALALVFGYNELAKQAETLGEKVFFRLARNFAEEKYKELGGRININEKESPVVVLNTHFPEIKLYPRDLEQMKMAIVKYEKNFVFPSPLPKEVIEVIYQWGLAAIAEDAAAATPIDEEARAEENENRAYHEARNAIINWLRAPNMKSEK